MQTWRATYRSQLCDFLVVRQILPLNPATSVKAPKQVNRRGLTPVLTPDEARAILDTIDVSTLKGLRDRALIATMTYTFARISATLKLRVMNFIRTCPDGSPLTLETAMRNVLPINMMAIWTQKKDRKMSSVASNGQNSRFHSNSDK